MNASPDRFYSCLPCTLAQECPLPNDWSNRRNFSNDAHDPGGETMCGIIQREYDVYRKQHGLPVQNVVLISAQEGEEIYESSYWLPYCPKLPAGVDLCLFDESVNAGPHAGVLILQRALVIPADGKWGPVTEAAAAAIASAKQIIERFTAARLAYYEALRGFRYFGRDWTRRTNEIGAQALAMAAS